MRAAQRGAGLLIGVLLLVTVAAFGAIVAASQSAGDIQGTDAQADSVQALYLAETGLERALKNFAVGTACGAALSQVITDLSTIGLGTADYTITIGAGLTTDFSGATLPATRCRIPVTATVNASNVSRTLHAIVDRNLLEGPDNPTFDNPLTAVAPSGWALNPVNAYADNGGPDGAAASCSRSAWVPKPGAGAGVGQTRRASGTVPIQVAVTAGSITTITYHRRLLDVGAGCADLGGPGAVGFPCPLSPGFEGTICFQMVGTGGAGTWLSANDDMVSNLGGAAACPSNFNPAVCSTNYAPPYPTKAAMNVTMTGATSVTSFAFFMRVQDAGRREMFLDHIEATNNTAVGAARVQVWRDCSSRTDPVSCT